MQPLQNGRCTCPEGDCGTKQFLDEDRPEGCIHCRTHSSRLPQVSFVLPQRHNLSVQVTGIRPECCTKNILQADEICFRTIESQRNSLGVLSGRHLCAGEDQGGDTSTQPDGLATTDELGILDQLREERSRAETHARVLRLQLQYQNNEDQCPTNKIIEIDHANTTTIEEDNDILLPMDCESPGEDDIDDTSNWRSVTPCEVYSERPCSGTSTTASELGKTLPTVCNELERTQLVVSTSTTSQWTPHHHEERRKNTRHRDLCRRVGHRLGCDISQDRDSRILVTGRKRTVNQREGVENDIVCPPTPCKRVRRFADQSLLRQYHGSEIRKEIRRDSLPISTRTRSSNLRAHSKTQHTSSVSTRTRSKECSSRLLEQKKEAPLRMETTSKVFQNDSSSMGASQTGRLCNKRKHKTTAFLESTTRPTSRSTGCLQAEMDKDRHVSTPTMEADTQGDTEDTRGSSQVSSSCDSQLAKSVLVATGLTQKSSSTLDFSTQQTVVFDRMAIIRSYQVEQALLDEDTINYLQASNNISTHKNYDIQWKRWATWCVNQQPSQDPLEYKPIRIVEFLTQHKELSIQQLNCMRSAIASVFKVIHPEKPTIASNLFVVQFFQAKRRKNCRLPNSNQEIYDLQSIIEMILDWGTTDSLPLDKLQQKSLLLVTMVTMWRPRSDIGRLQYRDVHFHYDITGTLVGTTVIARSPKEIESKSSKLGTLNNKDLCPVYNLWYFYESTKHLRDHLTEDHTLFLGNILETSDKIKSISPTTVANWIKHHLQQAGIDTTKFKAHSLRSAASTAAISKGASIHSVKMHANWSLNSDTLEKYYYKPRDQHQRGRILTTKIFENATENRTTSEVGVKPTAIVLGTTHNGNVGETKTENVVATRPWYRRWFAI